MTNQRPTEILGNSINAWDEFYQKHYNWVYQYSLSVCHNTIAAKDLTDKLFAKIVLSNPECVVENDEAAFRSELGLMFPYLGIKVAADKTLNAGRLLHLYYQPN